MGTKSQNPNKDKQADKNTGERVDTGEGDFGTSVDQDDQGDEQRDEQRDEKREEKRE